MHARSEEEWHSERIFLLALSGPSDWTGVVLYFDRRVLQRRHTAGDKRYVTPGGCAVKGAQSAV